MPWKVVKQGSRYAIVKKTTGQVVGHSDTRAKALASVRARYAATEGEPMPKSPYRTAKGYRSK